MGLKSDFQELASGFVDNAFSEAAVSFTFKKNLQLDDGQGGSSEHQTTFATVTGFAENLTAKEIENDGRLTSNNSKKFMFEYVAGIDSSMTIEYAGKDYDIIESNVLMDFGVWVEAVGVSD